MAAPSQPVLPSIFSLCDLSALDDDPSWLPLEGTLSGVSCLGFAADSMFASDLDPLSGAAPSARFFFTCTSLQRLPGSSAGSAPSDALTLVLRI